MPSVDDQKTMVVESLSSDFDLPSKAHAPMDLSDAVKPMPDSPIQNPQTDSPQPPPQSTIPNDAKTVIIFDWDDTLLASSFLSSKGYRLDNNMQRCSEVDEQLKLLEKAVINVITTALQYGEVHVITNAETGWVQLSAKKFIPGVLPILERVTVVSARSTYEKTHPEAPLKWKECAFQDNLVRHFTEYDSVIKNIISFGDSHVEREAVRNVSRSFTNAKTKSVKFAERPSMEQLRRQIDLITNCFQYIYSYDGDLDLMLTISLVY
jgi:hypothetical protein